MEVGKESLTGTGRGGLGWEELNPPAALTPTSSQSPQRQPGTHSAELSSTRTGSCHFPAGKSAGPSSVFAHGRCSLRDLESVVPESSFINWGHRSPCQAVVGPPDNLGKELDQFPAPRKPPQGDGDASKGHLPRLLKETPERGPLAQGSGPGSVSASGCQSSEASWAAVKEEAQGRLRHSPPPQLLG